MTKRSLNYYGYTREAYKECSSLIRSTNRKHITILNTWFLLINLLYLVFASLNLFGVNEGQVPFYTTYFGISVFFEIWLFFFPHAVEKFNYFAVFASIWIFLSYGIFTSIMQPYMPATMFLIFMVLTTLSFIGNMGVMIIFALIGSALFLWSSYHYKTFSIAYHDTYNVIVITTLSIALHYTFQRTRVSQFILYQRDLQIQKELEIKSSFDALTSLLNRGRFFSIAEEIIRKNGSSDYMVITLVDLDEFKQINDNLGHQMGDKVIQTVGKIILQTMNFSPEDRFSISEWGIRNEKFSLAGRLGGDEFILLLRGFKSRQEVTDFLKKILENLNAVRFEGLEGIHASLGATEISGTNIDIDNAYKLADEALYESKRAGKNQIYFSTETISGDA